MQQKEKMNKILVLAIILNMSLRTAENEMATKEEAIAAINWKRAFVIDHEREAPLRFIDHYLAKIEQNKLSVFFPFISCYYAKQFNSNASKYSLPLIKLKHFSSTLTTLFSVIGMDSHDINLVGNMTFLYASIASRKLLGMGDDCLHIARVVFGYSLISPAIRKDIVQQLRSIRADVEKRIH